MRFIFISMLSFFLFCPNVFAYNIRQIVDIEGHSQSTGFLGLVFVSYNYLSCDEFTNDIDIIIERLKKTRPFNEFNAFDFWSICLKQDEEESVFTQSEGLPPFKASIAFLDKISKEITLSHKIVIIDAQGFVSCAELSSALERSLIILGKARYKDEDSFAKGFLHELGHSLGLRDECVNCANSGIAGHPNCAVSKEQAVEWWGDLVDKGAGVTYVAGCCGNENYIRPTFVSLMNDIDNAEDFGPVNERYLRSVLENRRRQ